MIIFSQLMLFEGFLVVIIHNNPLYDMIHIQCTDGRGIARVGKKTV